MAVIDSYFNDFHCISKSGSCTDSHAVSGGVTTTQDGPYLIQNNFLEAAGEAVMMGGGARNLDAHRHHGHRQPLLQADVMDAGQHALRRRPHR